MLYLNQSNRFEVLQEKLCDKLASHPAPVFTPIQVIVPSAAIKRKLMLAIADRHGVCANVSFAFLAQWLWELAGKAAGYIIPALIVILLVVGIAANGWDQGLRTFLYWIAVNAGGTFIFSLIAWAHPLNIICCAVTAPFFALNPVLGVGMLGGILESTFRKPKVKDFETLNDDAMKVRGWYRNRILHCLLVFFLSSVGSMLGTFVAFPILIARLA